MSLSATASLPSGMSIIRAKVYSDEKGAPLWEQFLVTVWLFITYVQLPGTSALLYLMVIVMLGIMFMDKETVLPVAFRSWPLFLIPIWGMMSVLWSPFPALAFRAGVLMFLSPLMMVIMLARMDVRHVLRCLMFAGWICAFVVLPYIGDLTTGGPFSSKNYLGMQMNFMMLISFATLLNKRELLWIRIATVPFIGLGVTFVALSNSVTSQVFAVVGPVGILLTKLFWAETARIRNLRGFILGAFIIIVLSITMLILSMPNVDIVGEFLDKIGKSGSYHDRERIWVAGKVIVHQHPILGVGLEGFWYSANGAAQSINFYDHKPFGTKLSFHNSYLEMRVHLGIVGLLLYEFLWCWIVFRLVKSWLSSPHLEFSLLVVTTILIFTFSHTESMPAGIFNTAVNLLYIGSVATLGGSAKRLVGHIPITVRETDSRR
ncbi:MAG TPA: O-antigen ligase family protein [Hyphomonas sp.]|nr:O-antigen ligase family protein [Hyphomonas sp.]HPE47195.1 O-antigen ligase family protein [Hyphomonas sp.]